MTPQRQKIKAIGQSVIGGDDLPSRRLFSQTSSPAVRTLTHSTRIGGQRLGVENRLTTQHKRAAKSSRKINRRGLPEGYEPLSLIKDELDIYSTSKNQAFSTPSFI